MDRLGIAHGLLMNYSWIAHGLLMDCSWIAHGLLMDCSWIAHGLLMDCSWIARSNDYMVQYPQGCLSKQPPQLGFVDCNALCCYTWWLEGMLPRTSLDHLSPHSPTRNTACSLQMGTRLKDSLWVSCARKGSQIAAYVTTCCFITLTVSRLTTTLLLSPSNVGAHIQHLRLSGNIIVLSKIAPLHLLD
jgi:hypothetical protein